MATKPKKKAAAKGKATAKKSAATNGRKDVSERMSKTHRADKATFGVNDKRAQYARLVAFNHAVAEKLIPKDADINDPSINAKLEKAGLDLAGGNMLDGPAALDLISKLTAKGSTTGKPLTKAYSAEVRPFLKRLQFSDTFGNRGKGKKKVEENSKSE